MENASKALIIAGAILISILLIAISMYVYTSAQGTVTQAGAQMTAQEKDMYNSKINSYVGNSKAGIDAKSAIDSIISSNNANMEDSGKFIELSISGFKNTTAPATTTGETGNNCDMDINNGAGKIGEAGHAKNSSKYVNQASKYMQDVKSTINTGKRYNISVDTSSTGLIIRVTIAEIN